MFVSTFLLWWVTRNTWKHAQDSSERQLRAYVCVDSAKITGFAVGGRPVFSVTLKNVGQTPAYEYRQTRFVGVQPWPQPTIPPADGGILKSAKRDVGAGGEANMGAQWYAQLTRRSLTPLRAGPQQSMLRVSANTVTYSDAPDKPLSTFISAATGTQAMAAWLPSKKEMNPPSAATVTILDNPIRSSFLKSGRPSLSH